MDAADDKRLVYICIWYLKGATVPIFPFLITTLLEKALDVGNWDTNIDQMISIVEMLGMNWVAHLGLVACDCMRVFSLLELATQAQRSMRTHIVAYLHRIQLMCCGRLLLVQHINTANRLGMRALKAGGPPVRSILEMARVYFNRPHPHSHFIPVPL